MNAYRKMQLVVAILVLTSLVLSACGLSKPQAQATANAAVLTAMAGDKPAATEAPTLTIDQRVAATVNAMMPASPAGQQPMSGAPMAPPAGQQPMSMPSSGIAVNPSMTNVGGVGQFSIAGAPAAVDPTVVLRAVGDDAYGNHFVNTVGNGAEMMFAEPGTILYGPDAGPDAVKNNPHSDWISPITQQMLGMENFSTNTAEGAFTWATGAKMTVKVGDYTILVESTGRSCSNNWFVLIRGLFADGKQDSDRNTTTHFSDYVAGHTQVMWYPTGAYISEGNFLQVAEASHTGQRNCGAEGTSGLSVLMLDLNTGAYDVIFQSNLGQPWQFVASNWR